MPQVIFGHLSVVLDTQVTLVVATPFVGKAIQICISPGPDGRIPRLSRAAHAEEWSREGVVDGTLKSGALTGHRY